jgi:hypothetical protein
MTDDGHQFFFANHCLALKKKPEHFENKAKKTKNSEDGRCIPSTLAYCTANDAGASDAGAAGAGSSAGAAANDCASAASVPRVRELSTARGSRDVEQPYT